MAPPRTAIFDLDNLTVDPGEVPAGIHIDVVETMLENATNLGVTSVRDRCVAWLAKHAPARLEDLGITPGDSSPSQNGHHG